MNTKFNIGETIYIPVKVVSISVSNAGVIYKASLKDTISILSGHVVDVPEDVPLETQSNLHPKEFVKPKG